MSNLFWLTDAQMARLEPFFPKSHGKPLVDDRRVLSGIIFINRNGLRWCNAPREYGPPKTLYNRWKRWGDRCRVAVKGEMTNSTKSMGVLETVQFSGVHCLPRRALLSASLGRGEAGCAGKSVLRFRTK